MRSVKTTQKRTSQKKQTVQPTLKKHIRHAVVPHKGNQYRPHLVRLRGLTVVFVVAVVLQLGYGYLSSGKLEVLGRVSNISASDLLADTNVQRAENNETALTLNDKLSSAAFAKAQDMFKNNYWAHVSPTGVTPWKWIGDAGYNYDVAGENLAKNYPTAQATVDAWMASPTHRANILNGKYRDIGLAVVDGTLEGRETTLVVAYYGEPATAAAVEGATNAQPTETYAAPVKKGIGNPLVYFGTVIQSLNPATLGTLVLLAVVAAVAIAAHQYRKKLPVAWRRSWKLHHGMYTLVGVVGLGVLLVLATGGGSI